MNLARPALVHEPKRRGRQAGASTTVHLIVLRLSQNNCAAVRLVLAINTKHSEPDEDSQNAKVFTNYDNFA
jgi:hypothetical protein